MNMLFSYVILLYCIISNVSGAKRNEHKVKPKAPPHSGYANYIVRPRFRNRVGDERQEDKRNFDYNSLLRNSERNRIDTKREMFDTNEALVSLERNVMNDQRPKGMMPYRMRHRYFGGRKRSEAANNKAKRVSSSLHDRSNVNKRRITGVDSHDKMFDSSVRTLRDGEARASAIQKDQYDDLKYISTPNDLAVDLKSDDIDDVDASQLMQEDFSQMSNAELDAVITDRMNSYIQQKDRGTGDYSEKYNDDKRSSNKRSRKEETGLKMKKRLYRDGDHEIDFALNEDDYLDLDNAVRNIKDERKHGRKVSVDVGTGFEQFRDDNTNEDDLRTLLQNS